MSLQIRVIRIDPFKQTFTYMVLSGKNLIAPVRRAVRGSALGWKELLTLEETRMMGIRQKANNPAETETYDAGPTKLIVAANAEADDGLPGFRFLGGNDTTVGYAILFAKSITGTMADCPVDLTWLGRHLVWISAATADNESREQKCVQCGAEPIRDILDGDALCQACCDAWVRGEGEAARENGAS